VVLYLYHRQHLHCRDTCGGEETIEKKRGCVYKRETGREGEEEERDGKKGREGKKTGVSVSNC